MARTISKADFAPQLFIPSGVTDVDFYTNGFGATELRRFSNDDGTVHVVEYALGGSLFHLHEERPAQGQLEPTVTKGVTCLVGVFVDDVDGLMQSAIKAGATLVKDAENFEYGYRQGEIKDPFGHIWLIQSKIG